MLGYDYSASDRAQYTEEEWAFIRAMEQYRRVNHRRYPTCGEVLAVLTQHLGYRKVAPPGPLPRTARYRGRVPGATNL